MGASIAVVAPESARGRSKICEPCGGASSSFDGAAVTNKLFPRCAFRGPIKSACWGTANEVFSDASAIANHNDVDTAVINELLLFSATPATLAFQGVVL